MKILQILEKTEYQVTGRSVGWNERRVEQRSMDSSRFAGCPETRFSFLLFLLEVRELKRNGTCLNMAGKARSSQKHAGHHRDMVDKADHTTKTVTQGLCVHICGLNYTSPILSRAVPFISPLGKKKKKHVVWKDQFNSPLCRRARNCFMLQHTLFSWSASSFSLYLKQVIHCIGLKASFRSGSETLASYVLQTVPTINLKTRLHTSFWKPNTG